MTTTSLPAPAGRPQTRPGTATTSPPQPARERHPLMPLLHPQVTAKLGTLQSLAVASTRVGAKFSVRVSSLGRAKSAARGQRPLVGKIVGHLLSRVDCPIEVTCASRVLAFVSM